MVDLNSKSYVFSKNRDFMIYFMQFLQFNVDSDEYYFDMEPKDEGYLIYCENEYTILYMCQYLKEHKIDDLYTNNKNIAKVAKIKRI